MASLLKRGKVYYARYWLGKKQRMVCLHTKSYPFAKEKLRQIETSLAQGTELPLPSKTPIAAVVSVYVKHVQAKTIEGQFWESKTKVNRAIPVSRALRNYLDRYEMKVVPRGWYFPSRKGRRWDTDNFSQALRKLNRAAGLLWSCLDFRHTFGSQLAMKGESLYKIATLMGNSPEICRRHYAVLMPESLVDSVEFAPAPLEGNALRLRPRPNLYILPKSGERKESQA